MLLAVEGGGFFSSSASGYSKGLTLLFLGQKKEENSMRVTPWNHYRSVDQESHPDPQLASGKNRHVPGCASFSCFGSAVDGPESPYPPKLRPAQNQEDLAGSLDFEESKDQAISVDHIGDDEEDNSLKSSLKKSVNIAGEGENDINCQMERRKVLWTDATGGELFEIREFEISEDESDNGFDHANGKACACSIM